LRGSLVNRAERRYSDEKSTQYIVFTHYY
jgi:hypothetical protein